MPLLIPVFVEVCVFACVCMCVPADQVVRPSLRVSQPATLLYSLGSSIGVGPVGPALTQALISLRVCV